MRECKIKCGTVLGKDERIMGTALMAPRKKIKRNPAAEAVAKAII